MYGVFPLLFLAFALINTFNHRYIFQFSGIELPYGCRRKVEEARFRGNKENDITITSLKAMSISKNYIIRKNNLKRTKKTLPEIIGNNYFKYGMDRTLQHIDFPKCWYCVISDPSSKTVLIYELEKNKIWIIDDSMDLVDYSAEEEIDADDETEVDKETEAEECIEKFLEIHFKEWEISWFHVEPMTVYDSNRIAQEYGDLKAMEIVTNNKKYYYEEDSLYEAEEGWVWTLTKKDYQEWKVRKVLDSNGNDLYRDKEQK